MWHGSCGPTPSWCSATRDSQSTHGQWQCAPGVLLCWRLKQGSRYTSTLTRIICRANIMTSPWFNLKGTHYKFSYEDINSLIQQAHCFIEKALVTPLPNAPAVMSSSVSWLTQLTDVWLVHALHQHPVSGLNVVSLQVVCMANVYIATRHHRLCLVQHHHGMKPCCWHWGLAMSLLWNTTI